MHRLHASALSRRTPCKRGFTLVELMIVVAIVAILATIALPSYDAYIRKARRADAMASLSQAQATIERCYAAYFSYATPPCAALPATSSDGFYTIAATSAATTYTLTATAAGSQVADRTCRQMTIDQAGQRTAADDAGNAQFSCWRS